RRDILNAGVRRLAAYDRGEAIDDVSRAKRRRQPKSADALSALDQNLGGGESEHGGAVDFIIARQRGFERHRGRAIHPDEVILRGFPFALAHEQLIAPRRAAPVHAMSGLAALERAILP